MRVTLQPDDLKFEADAGQTLLEAARAAGVELPHACRGGRCGLCVARLVRGEIDYADGAPAAVELRAIGPDEVLLCRAVARTDVVLDVRSIARAGAERPKRLPARVAAVEPLGPELARVWLRLPRAEPMLFRAGQYLDILLDRGQRRSYSIASPPYDADLLELHLRRGTPGGPGSALFDRLAPGLLLEVEGPHGRFAYATQDANAEVRTLLLVAGGTGFAPVKSILRHVLHEGRPGRVEVYRGARHARDLYDHEWLAGLASADPRLRYVVALSDEATAPLHRNGPVHEAVAADHADLSGAEVYAAGPPPMLEALSAIVHRLGLPRARFHHDLPTV